MNKNLHNNDDLLVKYLLGEALPAEVLAVDEWLQQSEENKKYFSQIQQVWEQSLELAPAIQVDEKEAWQRFKKRIENLPAENNAAVVPLYKKITKQWAAVAAVIILAVAVWLFYRKPVEETSIAMIEKKTVSRPQTDTLPDGSIITLNRHTEISYPAKFTGTSRKVLLKGEAFFNVMPDKARPFIIQADEVNITVVGTSFNVKNDDSSTQVIVETGIVKIFFRNKTIELTKGEKVIINHNTAFLQKNKVRDSLYNYYRSNAIICNATPLQDVVNTLNEAYNVHIVLQDASLRQLLLTSTFKNESIESILSIIQQTFDLRITREGDNYFIYAR